MEMGSTISQPVLGRVDMINWGKGEWLHAMYEMRDLRL